MCVSINLLRLIVREREPRAFEDFGILLEVEEMNSDIV